MNEHARLLMFGMAHCVFILVLAGTMPFAAVSSPGELICSAKQPFPLLGRLDLSLGLEGVHYAQLSVTLGVGGFQLNFSRTAD